MTTTISSFLPSTLPRRISLSRTGRWLLVSRRSEVDLHDVLGTMPARTLPRLDGPVEFIGREIWALDGGALTRILPGDLHVLAERAAVPGATCILAGFGEGCCDAVIAGDDARRVSVKTGEPVLHPIEGLLVGEQVVAVYGSRLYVASRGALRAVDRRLLWKTGHIDGDVLAASVLFEGRALAVLLRGRSGEDAILVLSNERRVHQLAVPRTRCWAVAEQLGHAFLLGEDQSVIRVDLRYGRMVASGRAPISAAELVVDQDGRHAVLATADGREIVQMSTAALVQPVQPGREGNRANETGDPSTSAEESEREAMRPSNAPSAGATLVAPERVPMDARVAEPPADEPTSSSPAVAIPDDLPLALGAPLGVAKAGSYSTARAHLDALLEIVAARTALTIAAAWNSGRLSLDATRRPHELEVEALLGGSGDFAVDKLEGIQARLERRLDEATARANAVADSTELPFPALVRELQLSDLAAQIVLVVAAPALRSEVARLYSVLSNDPTRPLVDRALIEQVIAGDRNDLRDQIACELAADSPLVRHGVIRIDDGPPSLFSELSVSEALLVRLRGLPPVRTDGTSVVRSADVSLDALQIPAGTKRELVTALAAPTAGDAPLRLVVRGRRGSGRHSVVAAIAARVQREIVAIDMARFPRGRHDLVDALRTALFRASMHGLIPVLSGLEQIEPTETELRDAVCQVLRRHPGPVIIRTTPEADLPIDPGYVSATLPPLLETERVSAWTELLAEARLLADAEHLAARYRIGPGVIRKVVRRPVAQDAASDVTAVLDDRVRQHVASRLHHVARRVERTARWEDVALPDDSLDSLREFIGRARQRRTVYESWGYDELLTTARGLTALFYGPPGTGKTMVAGVIAKELGLDLYRVDLARVVSKWVGETEKNLAEVFDAAEEGQILILFDEADSLFAKRTDVRTSNDRYANLEVNYLLQRLDTFEGVAILTSNLDGAIDPAFKRRLSLRLQFPFPDEETRVRLWAGHVTSRTPAAGDFDFPELARKFPLSGGYIRNCVLRAAFLAAHEGRPMRQDHLLRAVQLEYREMGKLSTSSRLE